MTICYLHPPVELPDEELVARFRSLSAAAVSDALGRTNAANGIAPISAPAGCIAGPALTVHTRPGDNAVVHKALDLARAGEVLAIDAGGALDAAIFGDIVCRYARERGIVALVVDGAVRDVAAIRRIGYPVFARGVSPAGPHKSGPGEIGGTITLGGTPVAPGDLLVGDDDGVVVVPRERAHEVAEAAEAIVERERATLAAIEEGTLDRSWVDAALRVERR